MKAEEPRLRKGMTAGQAFQAIARACLVHMTANEPVLRRVGSPQALHQMRVAVRRLRAAMSAFRQIAADRQSQAVRAGLKWLAGELDEARNLDVFVEETLRPAAEQVQDLEGLIELGEEVRAARERAYSRALAAIDSRRYRDLLIDLAAWVETGHWIAGPDAPGRKLRERPAAKFAAKGLERRRKALKRHGKRLARLTPKRRHKLRIAAKKMRYTAEFFSGLYRGRKEKVRWERFIDALKELQDRLGELNDIAAAPETAAKVLLHGCEPERRSRAIFAAGRIIGRRAAQEPTLIESAERAYREVVKAKPFW